MPVSSREDMNLSRVDMLLDRNLPLYREGYQLLLNRQCCSRAAGNSWTTVSGVPVLDCSSTATAEGSGGNAVSMRRKDFPYSSQTTSFLPGMMSQNKSPCLALEQPSLILPSLQIRIRELYVASVDSKNHWFDPFQWSTCQFVFNLEDLMQIDVGLSLASIW